MKTNLNGLFKQQQNKISLCFIAEYFAISYRFKFKFCENYLLHHVWGREGGGLNFIGTWIPGSNHSENIVCVMSVSSAGTGTAWTGDFWLKSISLKLQN